MFSSNQPESLTIDVFNRENIANWQNELDQIPLKIKTEQEGIQQEQHILEEQQKTLKNLEQEISSKEQEISKINAVLIHSENPQTESLLPPGSHSVHNIEQKTWLQTLLQQKKNLQIEQQTLEQKISLHKNIIDESNARQNALQQRQEKLTDLIRSARQFLNTLRTNPAYLRDELNRKILEFLKKYQEDYLFNRTNTVRTLIKEISNNTPRMVTYSPEGIEMTHPDIIARLQYVMLCHLLGEVYERIKLKREEAEINRPFIQGLILLLAETHIPVKGDLPDDMQFKGIIDQHYQLIYIPALLADLLAEEEQEYHDAKLQLKAALTRIKPKPTDMKYTIRNHTYTVGQYFLACVDKGTHELSEKKKIPLHFATDMLTTVKELIDNPFNKRLQARCQKLADEEPNSRPSATRKLVGVLLMTLSILLIIGSVAALVASCGSSTFLSAWGIYIGTGILSKLAASMLVVGSVSSLFYGGHFFNQGVRRSTSRALVDTMDAIKRQGTFPLSSPEPKILTGEEHFHSGVAGNDSNIPSAPSVQRTVFSGSAR